MKRVLELCGYVTLLFCVVPSTAQSLGEVARQERARKNNNQQSARRVYSNEDLSKLTDTPSKSEEPDLTKSSSSASERPVSKSQPHVEELRSNIRKQKHKVQDLEEQIQKIQRRIDERESIGNVTVSQRVLIQSNTMDPGACAFSKANYYEPYKDWCDEPAKLASELDKRQSELKEARTALESLQEQARKLGYGNAFYDPD